MSQQQFPRTRLQYKRAYPGRNWEVKRSDGYVHIYHPTVDRIRRGDMIRVWKHGSPDQQDHGAVVVEGTEGDLVMVRHSVCGTQERTVAHHIDDVFLVWSIGGWDVAMNLIKSFNSEMEKIIGKR